jgi:soluble cytochrome b562
LDAAVKESVSQHYDRLSGFLRVVALRLQLLFALDFILLFAAAFMLALLGCFFPLALGEAFWYIALIYSLGVIGFLLFLLLRGLRMAFPRPPMSRVAKELEAKFPHLRDDVTNSLLLFPQVQGGPGPGQISSGLISAQIKKTAEKLSVLRPSEVVRFQRAGRHLPLLLPILLAFSAVLTLEPSFLTRSLALVTNPFSALPARETQISLEPKGSVILRGTPLRIQARATGTLPEKLNLALWPEAGQETRVSMNSQGEGRFSYQVVNPQVSFRYQAYNGHSASPVYTLRVVDSPDVKSVRFTLIPPDYARLPRESREGGHIEALKGTVVNLEGQLTKEVSAAEMVLNQEAALPLEIQGESFRGNWLVLYPGHYSFKVKDEFGFENPDPVRYSIRIIPDKPPEAEIYQPAQDLEISGDEEIPILYMGRDDFGITAVKLLYRKGEREYAINLRSPGGERYLSPQSFKWEMSSLALTPGEKVTYRVGVWDNDTISGPKAGYSRSFTLSIRDEKARAAREGEEAHQIAEALLSLLADHLEEVKDRQSLILAMEETLKRLDRHLEKMQDRRDRPDLEALRKNLFSLKERMPFEGRETVTQEMERLALLAEEMAKQARMNELEAMAKELRNRQQRLMDFLKDQKGQLTKEARDEALKELKQLTDLLRSIMEAMSRMAPQLPDEFVNSPELSGLDFQNLFSDLEDLQKKLMEGDVAGALEAAQKLLQSLSEMMAALGRAGSQAARSQMDRMQGEMSRQTGELDKILSEQKEILRETERIDRELRDKINEEAEKRMKEAQPLLREHLERLKQSIPPEGREGIQEGERVLQQGRAQRFEEQIKEWLKEFEGKPETRQVLEEMEELLRGLRPDSQEVMEQEQKGKFPSLSSRQEDLKERTRALKEKLDMIAQLFPGMDTEVLKNLEGAANSMGEASGKLKGEDAPGAIPPEQEVLRRLNQSQQAMRQMSQQMAMRGQINRWGRPWGYDPRPGWYYGPWAPLPTLPQPEVKRPIERGYTGIDREEFETPSKDAYQVPKTFREKIMEALKENAPSPYKHEVEQYFRGLSE